MWRSSNFLAGTTWKLSGAKCFAASSTAVGEIISFLCVSVAKSSIVRHLAQARTPLICFASAAKISVNYSLPKYLRNTSGPRYDLYQSPRSPDIEETLPPKGAVSNLTRSLAPELGQYGVRLNAVNPSLRFTERRSL